MVKQGNISGPSLCPMLAETILI